MPERARPSTCPVTVQPPPSLGPFLVQVAGLLLRGIERGKYHLPSADFGQNLLVSGMTSLRCRCVAARMNAAFAAALHHKSILMPCSPKRFPLAIHVLLGPILPLATSVFGWIADRTATRHNRVHGMPPGKPASSGPAPKHT